LDYLPVPGVLKNTLVLRHHRWDEAETEDTEAQPERWKPLDGHAVRFFVSKVDYLDGQGEERSAEFTLDDPYLLTNWASFPRQSFLTDANGVVTDVPLTVHTNGNLLTVYMAAYDWACWTVPATPLASFVRQVLRAAPPAPPADSLKQRAGQKPDEEPGVKVDINARLDEGKEENPGLYLNVNWDDDDLDGWSQNETPPNAVYTPDKDDNCRHVW
jgi:hypothetical protein